MNTDLKPGNAEAAKLTGAMLLREFLMLWVAPLQAHSRPLWRLGDEEDKVRLSPVALSDEELAVALRLLVGDDQEYPSSVFIPLFHRTDMARVVAARPTFDGHGLVPPAPPAVSAATVPVEVSSNDSRKEEEEEEEDEDEERDSEATPEGMGETSPVRKADLLRTMPDDDDEADDLQRGEPPVIPTRGRSALISRDATSAPTPSGAASSLSVAPSCAPRARAPAPQAGKLSSFKLTKRRVDYTMVDQLPSVAKKRKDGTVIPSGADPSAAAIPPSVGKESDDAHTSPARSASRGPEGHPREESAPAALLAPEVLTPGAAAEVPKAREPPVSQAMVTSSPLPPPAAPLVPGPSASPDVLEHALSEMTRLQEDLQGSEPHLAAGRLELASGWLHADMSVRAALSQAAATSEGEKQAAAQAAATCEAAVKDGKAA
nr:nucleolar and coiled-body phosphoprotein 1-like [Aegilops tauschii subsp. strangulata]